MTTSEQLQAHAANIDAAQREIDRRETEGEDMSLAYIDPVTYAIVFKPEYMPSDEAADREEAERERNEQRHPHPHDPDSIDYDEIDDEDEDEDEDGDD